MLFVAVFGVVALVPTGGALVLLRPYPRFWTVLSIVSITVAITAIAAAIIFAIGRAAPPSALATGAALSVLRILIAPLFALAFMLGAAFSPHRFARIAFLVAAAMEIIVAVYGGFVWFVPMLIDRV